MKKLVSSSEAAQTLGLSLQGIHYRIKKGQLESIKKDGKIFVYIDSKQINTISNSASIPDQVNNYKHLEEKILSSKDEQIELLKKTIKFMKRQHISEIERLDKNQTQVLKVFQSEVDLLKSAFNEMRNIYQVEHKEIQKKETKTKTSYSPKEIELIDIKDFFLFMKKYKKTAGQIKSIILERVKKEDQRFKYNKKTKEILIYKDDFLDLI